MAPSLEFQSPASKLKDRRVAQFARVIGTVIENERSGLDGGEARQSTVSRKGLCALFATIVQPGKESPGTATRVREISGVRVVTGAAEDQDPGAGSAHVGHAANF